MRNLFNETGVIVTLSVILVSVLSILIGGAIGIAVKSKKEKEYIEQQFLALQYSIQQETPKFATPIDPTEFECLSQAVYFEARGEDLVGQFAVAKVVTDRVSSPKFPNTICDVVTEDKGPRSRDCQFSYWCDGKSDEPKDTKSYRLAQIVSVMTMQGLTSEFIADTTHYHSENVSPRWSDDLRLIAQIGKHYFYE